MLMALFSQRRARIDDDHCNTWLSQTSVFKFLDFTLRFSKQNLNFPNQINTSADQTSDFITKVKIRETKNIVYQPFTGVKSDVFELFQFFMTLFQILLFPFSDLEEIFS